jgi:hypothetical protein
MSFVHCHKCGWDNRDFGYGPGFHIKQALWELWSFRFMPWTKRVNELCWWPVVIPTPFLDRWGRRRYIHIHKHVWFGSKDEMPFGRRVHIPFLAEIYVAWRVWRTQVYKTFDDFKRRNPESICPKCGEPGLDID